MFQATLTLRVVVTRDPSLQSWTLPHFMSAITTKKEEAKSPEEEMIHEINRYDKIVKMFEPSNPRRVELIHDIVEIRIPPLFDKINYEKMRALVESGAGGKAGTGEPIVQLFNMDPLTADGTPKISDRMFGIASMNKTQSSITLGFGLIVIPKTKLKFFGEIDGFVSFNGSSGLGILTIDDTYYRGHLLNGKYEGLGLYQGKDWSYDGEFKDGKRHGLGELIFDCGVWYLGDFVDDLMDGKGHYYVPDRKGGLTGRHYVPNKDGSGYKYQYRGQFQKGLFHGHGIYETPAHKIAGEFFNGVMKFVTVIQKSGILTPMVLPHKIMGKDYRGEVEAKEGGVICPMMVLNAQLIEFFAVYEHIAEVGDRLSANLKSHRGGYKMW